MSHNSLRSNALYNVVRQCCRIIFPMITYTYVARVLGSENLGRYSFADSISSYFLSFALLGIPTYAIREGARIRDDRVAIEKFSAEMFTINLFATIISLSIYFLTVAFVPKLQTDNVLFFIMSAGIIASLVGRDWLNTVYEDFKYISIAYILSHVIAIVLIFFLVKNREDIIIYTLIMMLANSMPNIINIFHTKKYSKIKLIALSNTLKHAKAILFLFCISVASIIYINSDITIIGFFLQNEDVGIYTMASKIYILIKSVLNAIISVAIPRLSYYIGLQKVEEYNELIQKVKNILFALVFPCIIGVIVLSKDILYLIGGKEYIEGNIALSILCLSLFFAVFNALYAYGILVANRKDRTFFVATIISGLANLCLNILFVPILRIEGAAITTLLSEIIVFYICKKASNEFVNKKRIEYVVPVAVGCAAVLLLCCLCSSIIENSYVRIIIAVAISIAAYSSILLFFKHPLAKTSLEYIRRSLKHLKPNMKQ